jgi:putative Holliday junction resolvase
VSGRVLAIDLGARRVGLAVSDPSGRIAQPAGTVERRRTTQVIEAIARLVERLEVERIVVGLPRNMDGTEGKAARSARRFGAWLQRRTARPVEFWDERLSTVEAERALATLPRGRRRQVRDPVAASLILDAYLRRHRAS